MKTKILSFFFLIGMAILILASCQKDTNNLVISTPDKLPETTFDYSVDMPDGFPSRFYFDTDDNVGKLSHEKATLGRVLFYDKKLSLNNTVSCATCHEQAKAFADGDQFSRGLNNLLTTRNSMALSNMGFQGFLFWDGRANDLREQVMMPIQNHIEMGIENLEDLSAKLETIDYYESLFMDAYDATDITAEKISVALAQFLGAMTSYQSKYDVGVANDFQNFTQQELNGLELFFEKLNCNSCHHAPLFTSSWHLSNIGLDTHYEDQGAGEGRFKVPSLRNIELTAPYMHDGRYKTLEAVVEHYNSGVKNSPGLDWHLRNPTGGAQRLQLEDYQKAELVAFLKTLTDYSLLTDERFSNPF